MAGISPISGFTPPIQPHGASGPSAPASAPAGGSNFAKTVQDAIGKINQSEQGVQFAMQDLLTGNGQDVLPAVSAMAKADLSFKLLLGVRNKVIEAYKQTMNMQV